MIVETSLLKILKLKNDVDIAQIKQIFISKNFLKVIIRLVYLLRSVSYKGRSITPKL